MSDLLLLPACMIGRDGLGYPQIFHICTDVARRQLLLASTQHLFGQWHILDGGQVTKTVGLAARLLCEAMLLPEDVLSELGLPSSLG